ncbi:phage tail assembly protein [Phormidesmis sp. 146-33]
MKPIAFNFTLCKGLIDATGKLQQQGTMRRVTGNDELLIQNDRPLQDDPNYGTLILLSQVITQLGTWETIAPSDLEALFLPDLTYLQTLFNQLNQPYVECCPSGEFWATP